MIEPTVLRALGTVLAKLSEPLEKLEIEDVIRNFQTTVLILTLFRRALNL